MVEDPIRASRRKDQLVLSIQKIFTLRVDICVASVLCGRQSLFYTSTSEEEDQLPSRQTDRCLPLNPTDPFRCRQTANSQIIALYVYLERGGDPIQASIQIDLLPWRTGFHWWVDLPLQSCSLFKIKAERQTFLNARHEPRCVQAF
jgi:hypothetical protein